MKQTGLSILLGILIGIGGTLGGQYAIDHLPSLLPNPQNNRDFVGIEDDYDLGTITFEEFDATFFPDDAFQYVEGFDELNIDERLQLEDETYFIIHDQSMQYGNTTVYYTSFTHFSRNLNVIWEYDFIPSEAFLATMTNFENYFDIDGTDLEIIGNKALITGSFKNFGEYFDENTQTYQSVFIGANFAPLGADSDSEFYQMNFAIVVDLDTYSFDIVQLFPETDDFEIYWDDIIDLGDDLLANIHLENYTYGHELTVYGQEIDTNYRNYYFFTRLSPAENDLGITLTQLGYVFTNLLFELDSYDMRDFNGIYHDFIDGKIHLNLNFRYGNWYPFEGNTNPLHVDFSNGFDLINPESRSEIEAYFRGFEVTNTTEEIALEYHAITDIETLESFHASIVTFDFETTQNSLSKDVNFYYASENDYLELLTEQIYNYEGEGVWGLQVISSKTTIFEYRNGRLADTTILQGDNGLVINSLVRTTHHFIIGGSSSLYAPMQLDNNLIPTAVIVLMDRSFQYIDGISLETDAAAYIEGLQVVEDGVEVALWTASQNPAYLDILVNDSLFHVFVNLITE